ncbi:SatD family protein [Clostridium sp. UBA1652]|uniref:SatD family protein n=1 Tax=Clostridium sp. UBA1652 TaxID=1946348 RepID=UPI00257FB32B|nr:SatD family protein [Clostridium sp. UBA1652]
MNFITMVCDLKNSRTLSNRDEIQYILIDTLKKCNLTFKTYIVSPFIITLGDEWQGLLKENTPYLDIINFFKSELPDYIDFYTGLGIGDISINNYELTVNQLDGPSFHLARKAIKYAKKNQCSLAILCNTL